MSAAFESDLEGAELAWLEIYSGYGAPGGGLAVGRAHRGTPPHVPQPGESTAERVIETIQALDAHGLGGVEVAVTVAGQEHLVRTGEHGYIDLTVPAGLATSVEVQARLADPRYAAAPVRCPLPVFDDQPGLAIISDVDDTLLDTGVVHKLAMIEHTLTRSSWDLRSFPGAAEALRAMALARPLAYISGSPWGLVHRIGDYFRRSGFPDGTLVLKRFSSEPLTDQMAYKWPHILGFVDALPRRRFILLGDSSEKDPEIYARLRAERPGRVEAIFIHLVTSEVPDAPRFAGMTAFRDWSVVAAEAAQRGLLP